MDGDETVSMYERFKERQMGLVCAKRRREIHKPTVVPVARWEFGFGV